MNIQIMSLVIVKCKEKDGCGRYGEKAFSHLLERGVKRVREMGKARRER
jgi:hypothetical protein